MPALSSYDVTSRTARELRRLDKYGMNLADFAAVTTGSSFSNFGNGTGYTVSSWISDGVFANLAAVQAAYPIVQSGSDYVDWVLLQSAIDYLIYDQLGDSNRKNFKSLLRIPAGRFVINRSLHIGYGRAGTPPANLNANGYVTITIEGEGATADPQQSGMPGTTIVTENLTYPGIVASGYIGCSLRDFTLRGPYVSYLESNSPLFDDDGWDVTQWRQTGMSDNNWIGGAAVNVGIGFDLYTDSTAASTYPARVLPSYFGGGTTSTGFPTAGGSVFDIDRVNVQGFIIGIGRPHGDTNGEFLRIRNSTLYCNVIGVNYCHSQNRNIDLTNVNIEVGHTAISSRGGTRSTANHHGTLENIHIGRVYQIIDHANADWSGPVIFRNCYAESFFRLGTFTGMLIWQGGALSSIEQEGIHGSTFMHAKDTEVLVLDSCAITVRDALYCSPTSGVVHITGGTKFSTGAPVVSDANASLGLDYMGRVLSNPSNNARVLTGAYERGRFGKNASQNATTTTMTYIDMEWADYYSRHPSGGVEKNQGAVGQHGSVFRYPVPKITEFSSLIDVTSRSGLDLTCPRDSFGSIPADLGDIYALKSDSDGATNDYTWFVVHSISGSNMVLRQLNNFAGDSQYDYKTNSRDQIAAGSYNARTLKICARIRRNSRLFFGSVTSGSNVITSVRHAFSQSADDFSSDKFDMQAGDWFLHQEPEYAATGATDVVANKVVSIDFTANSITLTNNFKHTSSRYPIVFYVRQFNA